ncbi:uncharacterized protein LOC144642574 [Oculina patagonica]
MGKEAVHIFGLISSLMFVQSRGLEPFCESNGTFSNVGDEWRPNISSICRCTAPSSINCSVACIDYQQNLRKPGDQWLEDPTTNCTCTDQNSVKCEVLKEPVCMDISGNLRKNKETWMNSSCVDCTCINGGINCTRKDVNISYGLYSVKLFPTCEKCDVPSRALQRFRACKVYRELSEKGKLFKCASGGFYIRDIHQCNGIGECPDESDEDGCDDVVCKDEEGSLYLIKDDNGWQVSQCTNCHCKEGLLTCRRNLSINFPAYYEGIYYHDEDCIQPQCNVAKFVREKSDHCEGVEFIENDGIYLKDQTWKSTGCEFYFPGAYVKNGLLCPPMARPVCYVYNGAICCASECPGLKQIADQMRFKEQLELCPNGRQVSKRALCRDSNQCLQNFGIQKCSSEVTCQDEDSTQYFEGATWSVGKCVQCSCIQGKINCSRKVVLLASFLSSQVASGNTFIEHCNQTDYCNVANFMKKNRGVCKACRWNSKLYYDGDHWKENGVDFYCSSSKQKVRPGCYVGNNYVTCTGAIPGIRQLSLISSDDFSLCKSGYQIISLGDRCNVRVDCDDEQDESNCDHYYCGPEMAHGVPWTRTREEGEIIKQCSLINSEWTGTFSSKCVRKSTHMIWLYKNTCDCEKKTLVAYFKKKIAAVNETNFMEISKDMVASAQAGNFTNPKAFHDMFKELFYIVKRIITPLLRQNADIRHLSRQYSEHFIQTLRSSIYDKEAPFCNHGLAGDRQFLEGEAFQLRQQVIMSGINGVYVPMSNFKKESLMHVIEKEDIIAAVHVPLKIIPAPRVRLRLQLNTAPRLPTKADGPPQININTKNNETAGHDTSSNKNKTTSGNMANELTNEQIKDILREKHCTSVKYDEGMGVFVYNQDTPKESLKHYEIQSNMELVLISISISAIVLALILLTALRLKTSERLFIHKSLLLSLGLGNLVFVLDKTLFASRQEHLALCSAVTVIQFFFHTAVFTWMLVEGINLYIKLVKVFSMKKQYATYVAVGWGIPTVIVGLVAAIKPATFDMGKAQYKNITCGSFNLTGEVQGTRCWINGSLWIYKGPILAILVANFVLFVILLRVIFGKLATKYGKDHVEVTKRGLRSIVALLPLLGVTWLLGFFIEFHIAVGYVFILLNSTQGVLFFVFHCALDDEVQDAIRKLVVKNKANFKTRGTPAFNPKKTPVVERHSRVKIINDSGQEKPFLEVVEVQLQLSVLNEQEHYKEFVTAKRPPTTDDSSSTVYKATLGGDTAVYEIAV